jgi:hypothetical protein
MTARGRLPGHDYWLVLSTPAAASNQAAIDIRISLGTATYDWL